jgi:hypothetical protein
MFPTKSPHLSDTKHFQIPGAKRAGLMGHLFPSFDGPVRASPYFLTPRKRRWWPLAVAFGAGVGCVFLLLEPSKRVIDLAFRRAPAAEARVSVEAAPADADRQAISAPTSGPQGDVATAPAGVTKAAEPMPRARPAAADALPSKGKSTGTKATDAKPDETKATTTKPSNSKAANGTRTSAGDAPTGNARDQANVRGSGKATAQPDQATGMVQVDEEELPDGRRVPVYRRATIFDGARGSGSQ